MNDLNSSSLAFFHPVGPHIGENLNEIITRKQTTIDKYCYTLWSFAPAKLLRINAWRKILTDAGLTKCNVYCCGSDATKDPQLTNNALTLWMKEQSNDLRRWDNMPMDMTTYHRAPNKNGCSASAFVVDSIIVPVYDTYINRKTDWFKTSSNSWENLQPIPTRGEYLIAKPSLINVGTCKVKAILQIKYPFIVWVK